MNILVLQGSPNVNGSTALLASEFARGAADAGHDVRVVNVTELSIAPCTGCVACGYGGPCAQADDFDALRGQILAADMLVFATPLYYFGMSAQLKAVLDRFCAANPEVQARRMKSALLAVAWNTQDWIYDALEAHYATFARYLKLQDVGRVLGRGCGTPSMTRATPYPKAAYDLGRSL